MACSPSDEAGDGDDRPGQSDDAQTLGQAWMRARPSAGTPARSSSSGRPARNALIVTRFVPRAGREYVGSESDEEIITRRRGTWTLDPR